MIRPEAHANKEVNRNKNPLLKKPVQLKDYAVAPQIVVLYPEERSTLCSEAYLKRIGLERNAVATVPHTFAALHSLPNTNLICAIPERAVKTVIKQIPLTIQPIAFKKCSLAEIEMVWHPKNRSNPAHQWLRESIIEIAKNV